MVALAITLRLIKPINPLQNSFALQDRIGIHVGKKINTGIMSDRLRQRAKGSHIPIQKHS